VGWAHLEINTEQIFQDDSYKVLIIIIIKYFSKKFSPASVLRIAFPSLRYR